MGEVIQNKDSFVERLKKLVVRDNKKVIKNNAAYEQYIEQEIQKMLKERGKFVAVTSPEEEKKFISEVRHSLSAAIEDREQAGDAINKKDEDKSVETKKEEIDEKKRKAHDEKTPAARDINSKQMGYLDRLELLHQMKQRMLREQLKKGEYVPNDKEYYKMLLLQKSIESDRENYLKGLDEKTRVQVLKVEEEYRFKELDFERRSNQKFRQELEEFTILNKKIKELNEWIEQKEQEMREGKVDSEEYHKEMKEKQKELDGALIKIGKLNPQRLQDACDKKARNQRLENAIMGKNYRAQIYLRSSDEMRERLNYKTEKENLQMAITQRESKFLKDNGLNRSIELDKKHKEELEKELEDLEEKALTPENIKRKAEVLKELRIVDARIDSEEEKKEALDQASKTNEDVETRLEEMDKTVEEDIKEIEEDFTEIEKNIEKMDKDIQTAGINGKTEEEIRKEALETGAAVGGAVAIAGGDMTDSIIAGAVAAEIKTEKEHEKRGKINEWEQMVNETPDEKAVENFRETQEAMKEQQEQYEQERIRK